MTKAVDAPGVPSIAVIVPNFNDARHLPRCIRSVLEQEVAPDEFIIVDDRSTDDSVEVIRALIDGRPATRLIENSTNLGTYGAVNAGLRHSQAEYALFLSANDFVLPGIFAQARRSLAEHQGAGLWSAMGLVVDEAGQLLGLQPIAVPALSETYFQPEQCRRLAWRFGSWFTGTTLIYRRTVLESVGRFEPALRGLSDLVTALMVAGKGGAVFCPFPYAAIRQHPNSYLADTLREPAALEGLLKHLETRGTEIAPELFTPAFLRRTARRFRFAAIRESGGGRLDAFSGSSGQVVRGLLEFAAYLVPRRLKRLRVAVAFAILRPFDVWPAIWNRMLGTAFVSRRFRGGAAQGRASSR